MFPLRDDVPSVRVPFVNYGLIGLCSLAFLAQLLAPDGGERIIRLFGMIPYRVVKNDARPLVAQLPVPVEVSLGHVVLAKQEQELPGLLIQPWLTLITCMFLHGGVMHIVGNMWFLLIFGDNVEDRWGHFPYLAIYLLSGLMAGLLQIVSGPGSLIPTVGASGAIAGVMGAYFLLFPRARVVTLVPLGIVFTTMELPAPIFLGIWFLFQIGSAMLSPEGMGGVAWWAHVGGFLCGLGLTAVGKSTGWIAPPRRYADEQ